MKENELANTHGTAHLFEFREEQQDMWAARCALGLSCAGIEL